MILDSCVEACNDITLLNILSIFKSLINLVRILVPVILVVFVMIDIVKTITSNEVDAKKMWQSTTKKIIAAVIIFLIFPVMNTVLRILPLNLYYINCYNCADRDNVLSISVSNASNSLNNLRIAVETAESSTSNDNYNNAMRLYEIARKDVQKIIDKDTRENYKTTLEGYQDRLYQIKENLRGTSSGTTGTPGGTSVATANIFVGDSRMVSLCDNQNLCTPSSDGSTCISNSCVAKVGAGYTWYSNEAISEVNGIISSGATKYNIIINMGVNDVNTSGTKANDYISLFREYAQNEWSNHNIIIVSVNPVTDGKSNAYTSGVEEFNSIVKNDINNANLSNYKFCDTYNANNLTIVPSSDGLHYDSATTNNIYSYIINNCL